MLKQENETLKKRFVQEKKELEKKLVYATTVLNEVSGMTTITGLAEMEEALGVDIDGDGVIGRPGGDTAGTTTGAAKKIKKPSRSGSRLGSKSGASSSGVESGASSGAEPVGSGAGSTVKFAAPSGDSSGTGEGDK